MSDVFISYSREDIDTARLISQKLEAAGFSVWWDRRIPPGKTWDQVIGESLDSSSCVIVLWSKLSVQSRWVREEAERGADRSILIPVFIEKVDPPFGFGRIEGANLAGWHGEATDPEFASVCEAITGFLKGGTRPIPKPAETPKVAPPPQAQPQYTPQPLPQQQPQPVASIPYFLGRWQANTLGGGSDVIYMPDGSFSGMQTQNIGGFNSPYNVFGRWNILILGPDTFQLQLWYANMTTWAGTFRILDIDHIQNLEWNYVATRVR